VNPRPRLLACLALIAVLALSACSKSGSQNAANAATVNGNAITNDQVQNAIPAFEMLAKLNQSTCGGVTGSAAAERSACARVVLTTFIQGEVVGQYAAAHGIKPDAAGTDAVISRVQTGVGGAAAFTKLLSDNHVTADQFRSLLTKLSVFQTVRSALGAQQLTDATLQQDYQKNKAQYTNLHVQHILVKTKAEAEKILKQANPQNFADLAKKYSTDPSAAQNGGDINSPASGLVQPFVDAVLAAKPGDIIGPVHTQFGWHVIHVISVDVTPFDQAKADILSSAAQPIFSAWLTKQTAAAKITVNPRYGMFDQQQNKVVPVTNTVGSPSATDTRQPVGGVPTSPASPSP
jgi:parvulin-like peptidyl-prolyl isomerase